MKLEITKQVVEKLILAIDWYKQGNQENKQTDIGFDISFKEIIGAAKELGIENDLIKETEDWIRRS